MRLRSLKYAASQHTHTHHHHHHPGLETSSSHWWIIWVILRKQRKGSGVSHVDRNNKQGEGTEYKDTKSEYVWVWGHWCIKGSVSSTAWLGRPQAMLHKVHWAWKSGKKWRNQCMTDTYPASKHRPILFLMTVNHYWSIYSYCECCHQDWNHIKSWATATQDPSSQHMTVHYNPIFYTGMWENVYISNQLKFTYVHSHIQVYKAGFTPPRGNSPPPVISMTGSRGMKW